MKTDFYTKTVLTIIAVCLTVLTLQNVDIIPKAYAAEKKNNLNTVPDKNYALVPVNENGTIDVVIRGINTSDELDVNIDEVGGMSVYRAIPVRNE